MAVTLLLTLIVFDISWSLYGVDPRPPAILKPRPFRFRLIVAFIVCEKIRHENNNIDFYLAHSPEIQINALYNKNMHKNI